MPSVRGAQGEIVARQVAAPATDILNGHLTLPDLAQHGVRMGAAVLPIDWSQKPDGTWSFEAKVALGSGPLSLAWTAQGGDLWSTSIQEPGREPIDLDRQAALGGQGVTRGDQSLDENLSTWMVRRFDIATIRGGDWNLALESPAGGGEPSAGFLVVRDSQPLVASAHLTTHHRLSDRAIGIRAHLELTSDGGAGVPLALATTRALVSFSTPRTSGTLELLDDGLHGDGNAGDGRFGGRLPEGLVGKVQAHIDFVGTWKGEGFVRSSALSFDVSQPLLELTGGVRTRVEDARRLRIDIEAWPLAEARRVIVSAEVWGRDGLGHDVPVTWLSRIETPEAGPEGWHLPLWLDTAWLAAAQAYPPLELRAVRVQDPDHYALLAQAQVLDLPDGSLPPLAGRWDGTVGDLVFSGSTLNATQVPTNAEATNPIAVQPGLMLVHGYCSSGSVWPESNFSQPKLTFSDVSQNRSHDQFAQLIAQQGSGFTSFGVVGHSQGGQAALHLLTFYQSPLDRASGGRRIQSVGSPYQGTPLASLGAFACGVNNDMTPAGASTWLAGIPMWARAEVSYWTTSNSGAACNFFTSLLLADPEDGTTEQFRGQLPGGNNMGHVTGWCHTTGMSEPAQYTDASRNFEMNLEAAR